MRKKNSKNNNSTQKDMKIINIQMRIYQRDNFYAKTNYFREVYNCERIIIKTRRKIMTNMKNLKNYSHR